jgi:hypothetical protein
MEYTYLWHPWLSGSYHPQVELSAGSTHETSRGAMSPLASTFWAGMLNKKGPGGPVP